LKRLAGVSDEPVHGFSVLMPGIVTAVVGQCDITLDQRHLNGGSLATMLQQAKEASERFAAEEKVSVEWNRLWQIHPILFDPELVEMADEAIRETCGQVHRLPSGPLHDAAEVARAGVPTIMLFVQSLRGLSHAKEEDTREEHLALSVQALDRLTTKTISWLVGKG
jgi:N-carbamoyl-L-amino-acid hydrolase